MSVFGFSDLAFMGAVGGAERDPFFANVSLLLHGDGANGSTSFIDSSPTPKTVTAAGNAQISTAQSRFGGSIVFDGSGDYLLLGGQSDFAFGLSDFTIECFYYPISAGGSNFGTLIDTRASGESFASGRLSIFHNGGLALSFQGATGIVASSALAALQWHHVAMVRSSGITRGYLNGVQVGGNINDSVSYGIGSSRPIIGSNLSFVSGLNGYIDELRITKGIARYTANFTPPTAPFPDA